MFQCVPAFTLFPNPDSGFNRTPALVAAGNKAADAIPAIMEITHTYTAVLFIHFRPNRV